MQDDPIGDPIDFKLTGMPLGNKLYDVDRKNGYHVDVDALDALVTDDTKLICINNPDNPTGALLDTDLTAVDELHTNSKSDYISRLIQANGQADGTLRHDNCRYILRDSINRFQTSSDYRNGLGFEYNSVTGAVTRNFD